MVRIRCSLIFATSLSTNGILTHNAFNAFVVYRITSIAKCTSNSCCSIRFMVFIMDLLNQLKQLCIRFVTQTWLTMKPGVVTASGHFGPAHHLCNRIFVAVCLDIVISDYFRFLAKKALAFFRNSFSC